MTEPVADARPTGEQTPIDGDAPGSIIKDHLRKRWPWQWVDSWPDLDHEDVITANLDDDQTRQLHRELWNAGYRPDDQDLTHYRYRLAHASLHIGYTPTVATMIDIVATELLAMEALAGTEALMDYFRRGGPIPAAIATDTDWTYQAVSTDRDGPGGLLTARVERARTHARYGATFPLPPDGQVLAMLLTQYASEAGWGPDHDYDFDLLDTLATDICHRPDILATARALDRNTAPTAGRQVHVTRTTPDAGVDPTDITR